MGRLSITGPIMLLNMARTVEVDEFLVEIPVINARNRFIMRIITIRETSSQHGIPTPHQEIAGVGRSTIGILLVAG